MLLHTGSYDFIAGGTGSGNVNKKYIRNVQEGLEGNGVTVDPAPGSWYKKYIAYTEETMANNGAGGGWGKPVLPEAELSANFNVIAEKVDTTVSGVNDVMDTLNASDLEGTITSMKALLENINDPDGSIGKLLKDDSVYNSVDSLLKDVDVLVNKIQENPKKYIKISVF